MKAQGNSTRAFHILRGLLLAVIAVALAGSVLIAPFATRSAFAQTSSPTQLTSSVQKNSSHTILAEAQKSQDSVNAYVDYDSWSQVAQKIEEQVNHAVQDYNAHNFVTAQSEFRSTTNVTYVASNFVTAIRQYVGMEQQQSVSQLFQNMQMLFFAKDNGAHIAALVPQLVQSVHHMAQTLDSNSQVLKPRQYDKYIRQKTEQERKKLDAAMKPEESADNKTWLQIAQSMNVILDKALQLAKQGQAKKAYDAVNDAYYKNYEKYGFEKNVSNAIGSSRVSAVEEQFKETKYEITQHEPISKITASIALLKKMLIEDAHTLDGSHNGGENNPFMSFLTSSFGQAFAILIREGLEALLVVAAIIAYLLKSGNKHLIRWIYVGVLVGIVGSLIVAALFGLLYSGNGPQQEILEGVVALVAMVMLLYTSNWMLSKSDVQAWQGYIKAKTEKAIEQSSTRSHVTFATVFSLAMLSFLAVFREGAETVLFYESIYSLTNDSQGMLLGAVSAVVVLLIIFFLIRFTSVHIPLKPFFIITSVVMAILVVAFAGGGVHSLIEGDVFHGIYLSGLPTNEWLGFYPFVETIVAQVIAILLVVGLFGYGMHRKKREKLQESNEVKVQTVATDEHANK